METKPPLSWGMLDLEEGTLRIEGRYMKNDFDLHVPLHPELVAELVRLRKAQVERTGRLPAAGDPVVPGVDEAGMELRKAFTSALARAGLGGRDFRIHDLRHTFVSWLGAHCVHNVMKKLAGHVPTDVTDRYGQHQEMDVLRRRIEALPRLLRAAEPAAKRRRARPPA